MSADVDVDLQVSYKSICLIAVLDVNGNEVDVIQDIQPGGTVTLDATASTMRSCSFQCLDPTGKLTPDGSSGELNPTGVEVAIYLGYMSGDDAVVWPQGIFGVEEVDTATGVGSVPLGPIVNVVGYDRSKRISVNIFRDAFNIAAGTTVYNAVTSILASQAPWVTRTNIAPTDFTIAAQSYQPGDDPWNEIQMIAASAGMVAFFDASGVLTLRNNPSAAGRAPAVAIVDGSAGIAADVTNSITNSPGYNGVIVTASTLSGGTVSGSAYDMDPLSPTFAGGTYGFRAAPPVAMSTVTSSGQCAQVAAALLPQVLGLTRSVLVDLLPVPFLDAFDLVHIVNSKVRVKGTYITQQITRPMDSTQLETGTFVPIGIPLNQLDGLGANPSIAAFSSTTPNFSFNGATGTYTGFTGAAGGGGGFGAGLGMLFGGAGIFGIGGGGAQALWPNGLGRRWFRKGIFTTNPPQ